MSDIWPEGITDADAETLDELAAAGIGEGDFDDDHTVPPELTDLYIEIEQQGETVEALRQWAQAVEAEGQP